MEKKAAKEAKGKSVDKKGKDTKESSFNESKDGQKKPLSGYMLFCKEERPKVVKEHPDMKAKEVMTELGKRWKALSDEGRKKHNDKSADLKSKFNKENEVSEKRQPSKPKKDDVKANDKGKKQPKKKAAEDDD